MALGQGRDRRSARSGGGAKIIGNGSEVRGRPQPDRSERRSLPTQASDEIGLN